MKKLHAVLALAAAAFVIGCDSVNTVERAAPEGRAEVVHDKRVITDGFANRYARVVAVNQATAPGGILKIQVTLRNTSPFDQRMIYKFEWFDQEGMLVDTISSTWQAVQFQAKEEQVIGAVAPGPTVKDFKLKIQESKDN